MFTTGTLLALWERDPPPAERPLQLLTTCDGGEVSALPLDEVNRRLLDIRADLFGDVLGCYAECPRCTMPVEFSVSVDALVREVPAAPGTLRHGRLEITCRPPTAADVAAAAGALDPRRALCGRCVTSVVDGVGDDDACTSPDGARGPPVDLSDDVVAAVEEHLDRQHPLLAVTFALTCPDCGHGWSEGLDVAAHLWADIDRWALRLLADVAVLGRAYGWAEHDVLAMTPLRRTRYLELVQ